MEKQRLHRLLISPQILLLQFSFSQKPAASSPQRRLQLPSSSLSPYSSTAVGCPSLIESPALPIAGDSHRSSPYLCLFLSSLSILSPSTTPQLASDAVPTVIPCRTRSRCCHRRLTLTAAGSLSAASLYPSLCSARHRAIGWRCSPPPFRLSLLALVIAVATAVESARLLSWLSLCRRSWGSASASSGRTTHAISRRLQIDLLA
ncbi:uncharacterized protein LOC121795466 [Salvia splendens]|uniref:uncharacterized protein LOC121795466 n=1 Tax=Salvia splendens TaxID=180675 RepID=UPI001C26DD64|nr:uncharacterized protein LOC121795466 [Salvia splendens]